MISKLSKHRIIIFIFLIISVWLLPFWFYLPLIAVAIFVTPFFLEGVFLGLLIDTLYGGINFFGIYFPFLFSVLAVVLLLVSIPIRERLRFDV